MAELGLVVVIGFIVLAVGVAVGVGYMASKHPSW